MKRWHWPKYSFIYFIKRTIYRKIKHQNWLISKDCSAKSGIKQGFFITWCFLLLVQSQFSLTQRLKKYNTELWPLSQYLFWILPDRKGHILSVCVQSSLCQAPFITDKYGTSVCLSYIHRFFSPYHWFSPSIKLCLLEQFCTPFCLVMSCKCNTK